MTPTRGRTLLLVGLVTAVVAWLLADAFEVPALPRSAPLTAGLLALVELAMAKVVRDRLRGRRDERGRPVGRPLHPVQVAKAAALAKASSPAGALLAGAYAGVAVWALPDPADGVRADGVVAVVSALVAVGLVLAALALERACRAPVDPVGSPA